MFGDKNKNKTNSKTKNVWNEKQPSNFASSMSKSESMLNPMTCFCRCKLNLKCNNSDSTVFKTFWASSDGTPFFRHFTLNDDPFDSK